MSWSHAFVGTSALVFLIQCGHGNTLGLDNAETFAELRAIKGETQVVAGGKGARAPLTRERLVEGEVVTVADGALAWMRRDAGATWLVKGPARLTVHAGSIELTGGRVFVDADSGPPSLITTPRGPLEIADARASIEVSTRGDTSIYVLRGSARTGRSNRVGPGELVTLNGDGTLSRKAEVAWDDWTGGLATADATSQPAPYGIGTVGARPPGDKGKPRFSLVIQRLDVNVKVDRDFATTEVDETFVNPGSDTVEGIFSFRTPPSAVLQRFGVDRAGELVWGKIQESASASKQYESNVYAGSREDPALLQWAGPGIFNARLYPIQSGTTRRVVTRYSEWLSRQGPNGERRLYVYPMAAEGAIGSLPRIEELTVTFDLSSAGARTVRAGMGGKREGDHVVVKAFDFVPRADLAIELFDDGQNSVVGYRAKHNLEVDVLSQRAEPDFAKKVSTEESDYLLVPLRAVQAPGPAKAGIDLAIVVDTSAATEPSALAIARSMAATLLEHLGPDDRAALWTGDATLRPVAQGSGALSALDAAKRRQWLAALSGVERGGATDIGAILAEAGSQLNPGRMGSVVYIGDGQPTVGEIAPKALRERLSRLAPATRVLIAALGSHPNLALLNQLARGANVETIADAYGAAQAGLRLLEAAGRPLWLGATVDLGAHVERLMPRELPPIGSDGGAVVVGRIKEKSPNQLTVVANGVTNTQSLKVVELEDAGDLRRRWGEARLAELIEQSAGRSALVELGLRFGLVSPFTSIYVPTTREAEAVEEDPAIRAQQLADRRRRWKPWTSFSLSKGAPEEKASDDVTIIQQYLQASAEREKEGGTGTRAKGEEGAMGNAQAKKSSAPLDNPEPQAARAAALREAQEFGMIGLLSSGASGAAPAAEREQESAPAAAAAAAPTAPWGRDDSSARGNMWGDETADSAGAGGLGLSGIGSTAAGIGLGFGSGHGRLGGQRRVAAPVLKAESLTVSGRLPPEVITRIVRQNWGRFRLCYEAGLARNPNLQGRVVTKFVIGVDGAVSKAEDGGSDLPDSGAMRCIVQAYEGLSFPMPEGGTVTVVSPLVLAPGHGAPSRQGSDAADTADYVSKGPLGNVGHRPRPCGAGADLPLDDRRQLWRERLGAANSSLDAIAVYRRAIADCEAPGWRERQILLVMMVDRMQTVQERVALWRKLLGDASAADVAFRSMLVRVQSAEQLHELHQALGFAQVDPELLAKMLSTRKNGAERLVALRGAALRWPDDLELALRVLDAYEDVNDVAGGRAWARRLRRRIDATSHVHANVGEYYLRLSVQQTDAERERDANEARRAFGEIVEFAPEDPAARRYLGDLLRAHGWFEEAFRQYETLAQLTPDDTTVPLLLAAAANGTGKVEQAVGWVAKAASLSSPDGGSEISRAAHATASAFLAWAFLDAKTAGHAEESEALRARARGLAGNGDGNTDHVRFVLTWDHPELHPTLWSSALGAATPVSDNFPLFGVAEVTMGLTSPPTLEIRLDRDDANRAARLGLNATITAIVAEGLPEQRVARLKVAFGSPRQPTERVGIVFENGELRQEAL